MTRVASHPWADVRTTKRGPMGRARKIRIFEAAGGICAWCQTLIQWPGEATVFDHRIPLALGGADDDDNIRPLHARPCDAQKTAFDVQAISKAKRIQKKLKAERKATRIKSRGFAPGKRKMASRPMRKKP